MDIPDGGVSSHIYVQAASIGTWILIIRVHSLLEQVFIVMERNVIAT